MPTRSFIYLFIAIIAGILTGLVPSPFLTNLVNFFSEAFIHLLKLVSLPLIFLALVTTVTSFGTFHEIKDIGKSTLKYTVLTTFLAAAGALCLYLLTQPRITLSGENIIAPPVQATEGSYWTYLLQAIPSNILQPFIEHNVLGVLFLAGIIGFAFLHLPEEHRLPLKALFNAFYAVIMKMTSWIVTLMPLAVWAFVAVLVKDLQKGISLQGFGVYLGIIVAANLFQAFVVLPLLLRRKGISVYQLAQAMTPALTTAFFAKSSAAAMPVAISCVEKHLHIPQRITRFCFPLCTSINMNACAAFILITVLFVSASEGVIFGNLDFVIWIFIAAITAFGNAGIPMGCFFIATSLLTTMNVPLTLMGLILPFYTLLDMLESAINIWSDACVTVLVAKKQKMPHRSQMTDELRTG